MQLVAYGAQDVYLTGSPQITFFKVVYRRHTNFAVEPIPQTFNGASDFGRTVTCTINRNGDLITNMYVNINLPAVTGVTVPWGYVRRLGHAVVQHYKIEIGGSKIDEQYGDWLNIWYELTHKVGQERGYAKMIGDVPELNNINTVNKPSYQLYVPLQFWFNRNNGLALPLIALQYHDVRITIDFRPFTQCVNYKAFTSTSSGLSTSSLSSVSMTDAQLIIDYVYLDSEERKRFAQASHEYLIEQLQFTGSESITGTSNKYRLNFNHPSKYLVWATHLNNYGSSSNFISYSPSEAGWEKARERFAKAVWFITRAGLTATLSGSVYLYSVTDAVTLNEVVNPNADTNAILLSNYVVAQMIFNTVPMDGSGSMTTPITASSVLDSIVVLENNFTYDWLSWESGYLVSQLFTNGTPSGTATSASAQLLAINTFLNDIAYNVTDLFNYGNYINGTDNPVWEAKLQLNGSDRFQARDGYYFNYVQPYQHFSNTPADGINVYSFALKPEDHQPSGSCNFSRIDNATLNVSFGTGNAASPTYTTDSRYLGNSSSNLLNIYTVNYNVLRVMSGMAGVAYSN